MKLSFSFRGHILLSAVLLGGMAVSASAATFTWTNFTGSPLRWGTTANWSPNIANGPNADGAVVDFQVDVPLTSTIGVCGSAGGNLTPLLTTLKLGDTNGNQGLTLDKGGAATSRLHFTNSTGSTLIEKRGDTADTIAVGSVRLFNTNLNIVFTNGTGSGVLTINCDFAQQSPFVSRLNIRGPGTLSLLVNNTHSGGTVINQTTVQFGGDQRFGVQPGSLDPANITFGNNATLQATGNNNLTVNRGIVLKGGGNATFKTASDITRLTIAGPIFGDGISPATLVAAGPGSIILSNAAAASTYSGPTLVTAGTFSLLASNYTGGGAFSVSNSAALTLNVANNTKLNASNVTLGNGGSVTLNLAYGAVGGVNPSNPALNVTGTFSPAAGNIALNLSGSGFVPGQFPLIDYTGGVLPNINNFSIASLPAGVVGTLIHNIGNSSIDLNISLVVSSVTWFGSTNDLWDTTTFNWNNGATNYNDYGLVGDAVLFDDTLDAVSLRTNINLTTSLRPALISVINDANEYNFGGAGKLTGAATLTKSGSQALTIGMANDYSGGSTISAGLVRVGTDTALGTGKITFSGGGLSSSSTAARTITNGLVFTTADLILNRFGDAVNNGKITLSGVIDFSNGGRDFACSNEVVISGVLTNGGIDQKQGAGLMRLEGVTGTTSSGDFQVDQGGFVISGGNITRQSGAVRMACAEPNGTAYFAISNGAVVTFTAIGANFRLASTNTPTANSSATNIADIAGTVTWTTNNTTGGQVRMGGLSAFSQLNLLPGGLLRPSSIVNHGGLSEINLNGGTLAPLADNTAFMEDLPSVLVRGGGAFIDTEGKNITIGQALLNGTGGGGLTKNGSGTLTLTGANTYTGNSVVNAGTLRLGPAHAGSGTITAASGATAGFLSAGSGLSVAVPSVTAASGASLQFDFTGQSGNPATVAAVVSTLTANGSVAVKVSASGLTAGTIPLLSYTTFGGGGSFTVGQLPQGVIGTVTNTTVTKKIELIISSVTPLLWTGNINGNWDVNSTTNWSLNANPTVFFQGDSVRLNDSAASTTVVITEPVTPGGVVISNTALSYTVTTTGAGKLSGSTPILKQGTNTLTINGAHDFTGNFTIAEGKVVIGTASALGGTTSTTIIQSNGTLDAAGQDLRTHKFIVSGSGLNGQGLIASSVQLQNCYRFVTMTNDASFGGINGIQWGLQSPTPGDGATNLNGNGFKLTKVGSGDCLLKDLGETYLGDIDIVQSALSFQQSTTMGDPVKSCTVFSNGVLAFRDMVTPWNKIVVINGGYVRNTQSGLGATFLGPVTLNGSGEFFITSASPPGLDLQGPVGGTGSLIKSDVGTLVLSAINTYSGSTIISNGTLQLAATGALASSTNVFLRSSSTVFDVSAVSGFTLGAAQKLSGHGTVVGNVQANGTVSPGSSAGRLSFNNDLTLAGTTVMEVSKDGGLTNDSVNVAGALTYGGTLQVTVSGATPLAVNDTFDLFDWATRSGSFSTVSLPSGYLWDTTQLEVNGTIRVTAVINPTFGQVVVSGNDLVLSGSGGQPGGPYRILASTNVTTALASWIPVATNSFDLSGAFTIGLTNTVSSFPQRFFRLSAP
jgi:fibronectin-binding autotransporter adhesin